MTYVFQAMQSDMETSDYATWGETLYCEGEWTNNTLHCRLTNGVIVHERVEADHLKLDSFYFEGSVFDARVTKELFNGVELLDSETNLDGVCATGDVEDGANAFGCRYDISPHDPLQNGVLSG